MGLLSDNLTFDLRGFLLTALSCYYFQYNLI